MEAERPLEEDTTLSDSDDSSLEGTVEELQATMRQLYVASKEIRSEVSALYRRAVVEQIDWLEEPMIPKKGAVRAWCAAAGLPARPTLAEFLDTVYARAESLDLESRVLIVSAEDAKALWSGRRRLTVFEVVAALPTLLESSPREH